MEKMKKTYISRIPTLLDLPAKIFPFFSSTSLACMWWLTMIRQWEPIIREYVCPYFPCSSLNSTWGGCGLLKLRRLPISGSAGRQGGPWGPEAGVLTVSCRANKAKLKAENIYRQRTQSISISRGASIEGQAEAEMSWAGAPVEPCLYGVPSMSSPWLRLFLAEHMIRWHVFWWIFAKKCEGKQWLEHRMKQRQWDTFLKSTIKFQNMKNATLASYLWSNNELIAHLHTYSIECRLPY